MSKLVLFPPLQSLRRPFDIFCYLHPEWLKCAIRCVCRSRFVSATLMYSESLEWSLMNCGERKRWQRGQRCELSSPPSLLPDIIKDGRGYHVFVGITVHPQRQWVHFTRCFPRRYVRRPDTAHLLSLCVHLWVPNITLSCTDKTSS